MNEQAKNQLSDNLSGILDWIKNAAESATSFIAEQTPLYIQEYLTWYFYDNLISAIIGVFSVVIFAGLVLFSWRKADYTDEYFNRYATATIVGGIGFIISFFLFVSVGIYSVKECIKVKTAPRVVMLEHVKKLIK